MEKTGIPRGTAAAEFERLAKEGRVVKVGEIGLAFTYKVRKDMP